MAKVLIVGASHGVGLECVRQALAAGHEVRAFARSADRIALTDPALEKRVGDALDGRDVRRALEGIDAVIQTLGVKMGPAAILVRTRVFSTATRLLVDAMAEAGVRRLIALTGFGAGDSRNQAGPLYDLALNAVLGRVYDDKSLQEYLIRNSGLDWVIARPVILTDGPRSGAYRVLLDPRDWRCGRISRADVADFLVGQITSDAYLGKTPVLRG